MSKQTDPCILEKKYCTIREVAQHFAVAPSLIRFWENFFGDVLKPSKTTKRGRKYTQEDIHQLGYIYRLVKEKGYSLAGARKVMQQHTTFGSPSTSEVMQRLQAVRSFLLELKNELM